MNAPLTLSGRDRDGQPYRFDLARASIRRLPSSSLFDLIQTDAGPWGQIVLKLPLAQGPEASTRLQRERLAFDRMVERRRFPVPYRGAGDLDVVHVITDYDDQKWVAGHHLTDAAGATRRFSPAVDGTAFALALLETVGTLHGLGIVHCDLKPDNLLFRRRQPAVAEFEVDVIDLAHAHSLQGGPPFPSFTGINRVAGTKGWTCPQRLGRGAVSEAWDVWGVALLLVAFALHDGDPLRSAIDVDANKGQVAFLIRSIEAVPGLDPGYVELCRTVLLDRRDLDVDEARSILRGGRDQALTVPASAGPPPPPLHESVADLQEKMREGYSAFGALQAGLSSRSAPAPPAPPPTEGTPLLNRLVLVAAGGVAALLLLYLVVTAVLGR